MIDESIILSRFIVNVPDVITCKYSPDIQPYGGSGTYHANPAEHYRQSRYQNRYFTADIFYNETPADSA